MLVGDMDSEPSNHHKGDANETRITLACQLISHIHAEPDRFPRDYTQEGPDNVVTKAMRFDESPVNFV